MVIPFNATIAGWDVLCEFSDTCTIDVLASNVYNGTLVSITDSGIKPNVVASASNSGSDLTGWIPSLTKGGMVTAQITGAPSTSTWVVLILRLV